MHENENGPTPAPRRAIRLNETIPAPTSAVWELISDFRQLDAWLPDVEMTSSVGSEPGAERRFFMGPARFVERLTVLDRTRRLLAYELLEGPLPVRDYEVTLSVADAPEGGARVEWSALYHPHGIDADKCDRLLGKAFAASLNALKSRFEASDHG